MVHNDEWYVSRAGQVFGPYQWTELVAHAASGTVGPTDSLSGPSTNGKWVPASSVPGLFAAQAAFASPAAFSPAAPRKRTPLVIALVLGAVALVTAACCGGVALFSDGGAVSGGKDTYAAPSASSLIETAEWGVVPANQVVVMLEQDASSRAAKKAAEAVDGEVTGSLDYIGVHIITTAGTTEQDLRTAINAAAKADGVEAAFPNEPVYLDVEFKGVACDPLDDRVYKDGRDRPQQMTGTPRAWDILRAAEIPLSSVHVGVSDDGLFRTMETKSKTVFNTEETDDELAAPLKNDDGTEKEIYSHGTMVTSIIAANADNGGMTGIASPLGEKLKVSMKNIFSGKYGVNATATPDAADPTKIDYSDGTFAMGDLVALKKLVDDGAKVVNCSWGNTNASPYTAKAYKRFFEYMAKEHEDVLFVCSAGNDGIAVDGSKRIPSGLALPNMITVGNLENNGTRWKSSNQSSANYEVTLAAPGHRIVGGVSPDGTVVNEFGGTSSAAPQVTSAAALLLAVNPDLKAADLKRILTENARAQVESADGTKKVNVPASVGGKCLAIDRALLTVVNEMRVKKGLKPLDDAMIANLSRVILIARSGENDLYVVRAGIPQAGAGGTDVELTYSGAGAIGGLTKQHVAGGGAAQWTADLLDDSMTIHVKRLDNGACSRVTIKSMAGTYKGYYDTVGRTGSGKSGSYRVPMTVVVEADGSFTGKFGVTTSLPNLGVTRLKESGTFKGKVKDDGSVKCTGTAKISATFESGYTASDTGKFTLTGKLSGDKLKGKLKGVGGTVPFTLTRQ